MSNLTFFSFVKNKYFFFLKLFGTGSFFNLFSSALFLEQTKIVVCTRKFVTHSHIPPVSKVKVTQSGH